MKALNYMYELGSVSGESSSEKFILMLILFERWLRNQETRHGGNIGIKNQTVYFIYRD